MELSFPSPLWRSQWVQRTIMFTSTTPVQLEEEVSASSVRYGRHLSIWGSRRTRMRWWGGKLEDLGTRWRQHFFLPFLPEDWQPKQRLLSWEQCPQDRIIHLWGVYANRWHRCQGYGGYRDLRSHKCLGGMMCMGSKWKCMESHRK